MMPMMVMEMVMLTVMWWGGDGGGGGHCYEDADGSKTIVTHSFNKYLSRICQSRY